MRSSRRPMRQRLNPDSSAAASAITTDRRFDRLKRDRTQMDRQIQSSGLRQGFGVHRRLQLIILAMTPMPTNMLTKREAEHEPAARIGEQDRHQGGIDDVQQPADDKRQDSEDGGGGLALGRQRAGP